jgi:hypothetical protein
MMQFNQEFSVLYLYLAVSKIDLSIRDVIRSTTELLVDCGYGSGNSLDLSASTTFNKRLSVAESTSSSRWSSDCSRFVQHSSALDFHNPFYI